MKVSRGRGCLILAILLVAVVAFGLWWLQRDPIERRPVSPSQRALADRITSAGANDVDPNGNPDGGMTIDARLDGRQFVLAVPARWNGQAVLFAHGYSAPGTPVAVPRDPLTKDPAGGLTRAAYGQGFAVGYSAYDKAGIGVESGARATLALRRLVGRITPGRVYVAGGSMGGNIVMALIEREPQAFAGALSACGVTTGWQEEIGALIDMRAAYNYFTRDTPYALPGNGDLQRSALNPLPPALPTLVGGPWRMMQMKRLASPIERLFDDARANPAGPAAGIVRKISSLVPFDADPASFIFPLITVSLGQDDMKATFGGNVYGNVGKHYQSAALNAAETAALNAGIQRIAADAAAVRYADDWHRTTGRFSIPLVAMHNRIDSLVPYNQAEGLQAQVARAGNTRHLVLFAVDPVRKPIPGTGVSGYTHCGFTPAQLARAWNTLRQQVERGTPR